MVVVDDHAANRALAQEALEDEGYRVLTADSGRAALELFDQHGADCVLLDVHMPEMNGFEVAKQLRSRSEGRHIGVVFLTASRDVDTFDAAQRSGGDDFLTKPVRPAELVSRVDSAVRTSRLNEELREQSQELRRQRDDLMRLQLVREGLAAFLVHDLKNPVNSLDLQAQLLLRHRELPDDVKNAVATIRADARRLQRMISNILDLSRIDESGLEPACATVDLPALVREVLDDQALSARTEGVKLSSAIEVTKAWADVEMLRRVLTNLVENAIRHTATDSEVWITAKAGAGGIEIRVVDQGPGIPATLREKVFERHFRSAQDRHATRAGHGLGLAYCRAAVSGHGGSILVEPTRSGTTILITLPLP
ncbi:MAG: hybrid sensor histidine kinase/response regulator [Myxococcales bacterium FL481]|nr:MAG: hybrid sensor histidine kinase/response regulator [Myxococcales bacterium FL481]